ncbi:unnamed protein product [Effrenium voratum]|nr:unnamed protein product [Effrenium voratum]
MEQVYCDLHLDLTKPLQEQPIPAAMKQKLEKMMAACAEEAAALLTLASSLGQVVILTLSRQDWVADSCRHFCPSLQECISALGVRVVHAQRRPRSSGEALSAYSSRLKSEAGERSACERLGESTLSSPELQGTWYRRVGGAEVGQVSRGWMHWHTHKPLPPCPASACEMRGGLAHLVYLDQTYKGRLELGPPAQIYWEDGDVWIRGSGSRSLSKSSGRSANLSPDALGGASSSPRRGDRGADENRKTPKCKEESRTATQLQGGRCLMLPTPIKDNAALNSPVTTAMVSDPSLLGEEDQGTWRSVVSIGDSDFERLGTRMAAQELKKRQDGQHVTTKTLKTMEKPTTEELTTQLRQITTWLPNIVLAPGDLDVQLLDVEDHHIKALDELLRRHGREPLPMGL